MTAQYVLLVLFLSVFVVQGLLFEGFWGTNYNETITVCAYDKARNVLLARTHWPGQDFNQDSAALQGDYYTIMLTLLWDCLICKMSMDLIAQLCRSCGE